MTALRLLAGAGGLPTATLTAPDGARAEIALHGGHVLSWCPAPDGRERLFLSARSAYRTDAAIRGGVPVIFPQFADHGPLPRHGFARTSRWELEGNATADGDRVSATVRLCDSPATRARWPHPFVLTLTVTVGGPTLALALTIANAGAEPFRCTAALHSYLRVADVARTTLRGLQGTRYRDSAAGGREQVDDAPAVPVAGEVDRIYLAAPRALELCEGEVPTLGVAADGGFADVVVWNPGDEKGAALQDLEPGGRARFLCVEAAAVGAPIVLAPGARWTGRQTLTAR